MTATAVLAATVYLWTAAWCAQRAYPRRPAPLADCVAVLALCALWPLSGLLLGALWLVRRAL